MFLSLEYSNLFPLIFLILFFFVTTLLFILKLKKEVSIPLFLISFFICLFSYAISSSKYKIIIVGLMIFSSIWALYIFWTTDDVDRRLTSSSTSTTDMVGHVGRSMATIDCHSYGKVYFENGDWTTCTVKDSDVIAIGDDVEVVEQIGNTLYIKTIKKDC